MASTDRAAADRAAATSAQGPNPSNPLPAPTGSLSDSEPHAVTAAQVTESHANPQPTRTPRISIATNLQPSIERLNGSETGSELNARRDSQRDSSHRGLLAADHREHPLPPTPQQARISDISPPRRARTVDSHIVSAGQPPFFNVPYVEKRPIKYTVAQRLEPTVVTARQEKAKYEMKAKFTGYALNIAIGLQVLLGSLTTGLSAVAATSTGKQTAVQTTILGGLATLVASYLARARGSNEPELSITRVKDLEHFLRDCEAFQMDHGHVLTDEQDPRLFELRRRFEELLGNANGERKLSPLV